MNALIVILACFTGVFAFAFGMAGIAGLLSFEPPQNRRGAFLSLLDHLLAGGLVTMSWDVTTNWKEKVEERRLILLGLACGVACIILVNLASRGS